MIDLIFLPKLMTVHASATASPGPNFALMFKVATESARRKATLAATLGVTIGILAHASLAIFGVSRLLVEYPQGIVGLKLAACVYLVYLGVLSLRGAYRLYRENQASAPASQGAAAPRADAEQDPWKYFTLGLTNCLLNPKAFFYFVTVLPQGLTTTLNSLQATITLLTLGAITFGWFTLMSAFFRTPIVLGRVKEFRVGIGALTGSAFLVLAAGFAVDLLGAVLKLAP